MLLTKRIIFVMIPRVEAFIFLVDNAIVIFELPLCCQFRVKAKALPLGALSRKIKSWKALDHQVKFSMMC